MITRIIVCQLVVAVIMAAAVTLEAKMSEQEKKQEEQQDKQEQQQDESHVVWLGGTIKLNGKKQ